MSRHRTRRGGRTAARWLLATTLMVMGTAAEAGTAPARPVDCRPVASGADLTRIAAAAEPGTALCLAAGGVYAGPVRVGPGVTLWGPGDAVIRSSGAGTTVRVEGAGPALLGMVVDGSGGRFDTLDAAVRVEAHEARVEGVTVRNALFGFLVERSEGVVLQGNRVRGEPGKPLGLRGDAIRLWETRDSEIVGNRVADSRDLVVWYSPGNRIERNRVKGGRYGTHFMYSHDNAVVDNRYEANVVGVFAMYSRGIEIRSNVFAKAGGAAGMGLGSKESGDLEVADNLFLANTTGAYLDTSPLYPDQRNRFVRNTFRFSDTAVVFHGGADRNVFQDNVFRDNGVAVRVEGRGDARDARWRRNLWDDYAGYDLDGDGFGDIPYQLRRLSDQLVGRYPLLGFFRGLPALSLIELVGQVVPLFEVRTLLEDPEPRVAPPADTGRVG